MVQKVFRRDALSYDGVCNSGDGDNHEEPSIVCVA